MIEQLPNYIPYDIACIICSYCPSRVPYSPDGENFYGISLKQIIIYDSITLLKIFYSNNDNKDINQHTKQYIKQCIKSNLAHICARDKRKCLQFCLDAGFRPSPTMFNYAIRENNLQCVDMLIESCLKNNMAMATNNCLKIAISQNRRKCVKRLLRAGCHVDNCSIKAAINIESCDCVKHTYLHMICDSKYKFNTSNLKIIACYDGLFFRYLSNNNKALKDYILEAAIYANINDIAKHVLERPDELKYSLHINYLLAAIDANNIEMAKILQTHGIQADNKLCLDRMIMNNKMNMLKTLIFDQNIDIQAYMDKNYTPRNEYNIYTIKKLLKNGYKRRLSDIVRQSDQLSIIPQIFNTYIDIDYEFSDDDMYYMILYSVILILTTKRPSSRIFCLQFKKIHQKCPTIKINRNVLVVAVHTVFERCNVELTRILTLEPILYMINNHMLSDDAMEYVRSFNAISTKTLT